MNTSGKIRTFPTGSTRDSAEGKPPMELLPLDLLIRVAILYGKGAEIYGSHNWRKGQTQSAVLGSLMRHLTAYIMGKKDEDHLAAVIWNALSLMNVDEYHSDNKEVADLQTWWADGKPTGL